MSDIVFLRVSTWIVFVASCCCAMPLPGASQNRRDASPLRVLFIGNSYTAQIRASLMDMLAKSPYKNSTFEFITRGGATLQQHWNDQSTIQRIKTENWDFVVLQEQSQTPALPGEHAESFHASVDKFTELIRSAGAEPVLYLTWGRRDGDQNNQKIFPDYATMQQKLSDAYRAAAKRNRIGMASVGEVWSIVRKKDAVLGNDLYRKDGSHPSTKGAFLAACVFFRVLFHDLLEPVHEPDKLQLQELQLIKNVVRSSISIAQ